MSRRFDGAMRAIHKDLESLEKQRDEAIEKIAVIKGMLGKSVPGGLRGIIVKTLREKGPHKTGPLARQLETDGFRVNGLTPLNHRVGTELYVLKKKGIVFKNRLKEYQIVDHG